ncbi:MAG: ABC transporter permease [Planctomycetales bacterium]
MFAHIIAVTQPPARFAFSLQILTLVTVVVLIFLFSISAVPIGYNLRNLTVRWKTTIMTALAFTAVVGLLTVMLAFVEGMARLTEGSGHPENVIMLSQGTTDETFSNLSFSDSGDLENQPGIGRSKQVSTNGVPKPLCSCETYLVLVQPVQVMIPGRPERRFTQIRGIEDPLVAAEVHGLALFPGGEWFSQAGVEELPADAQTGQSGLPALQVVIGEGIAKELGKDRPAAELAKAKNPERIDVGETFPLGNRIAIVKGIMKSSRSTFGSEIWGKRSVVGPLFGKNVYTSIVARTDSPEAAEKLADFLNNQYKKAAIQAQVETAYFASLSETNKQFTIAISFVAVVMAIGGVFGVMNTMFAAVSQRIKDIGVLRLLGFARWQILVSFLLESLVIALIGGILGAALGSLTDGWTANSIVAGQGGGKLIILELIVGPNTIAVGLLLALAMGLIGGLVPSLTAMRLRALEALR